MARPRTVETDDVTYAARQLLEAGKPINGTALRRIIGRGRPDTLMEIYKEYIEQHGELPLPAVVPATDEPQEVAELPSELADLQSLMVPEVVAQLEAVFTRANQLANAIHNKRVNAEVMEARAKREEAARQVEELNQELTAAYNTIEDQIVEIELLTETVTGLKQEVAKLTEQLSQSERRGDQLAQEVKDGRQDIEDKAQEIKRLQHDLTVSQEQNGQLSQTLSSEREAHKQTLNSERQAHEKLVQEADTALKTCQQQLQDAQQAHQQVKEGNAGLTAKLEAAYSASEQQKLTHDELMQVKEQQFSQQAEQLQELQQQHQATEQALTDSQAKCAELDKDLALAQSKADEVPTLREKNEVLQAQLLQLATERPEPGNRKQ